MINTINIKLAISSHTQLKSLANLVTWKNQGLRATWRQLLHQIYMYKNTKMSFTLLDVCILIHMCRSKIYISMHIELCYTKNDFLNKSYKVLSEVL